jgi:hypothetical protein
MLNRLLLCPKIKNFKFLKTPPRHQSCNWWWWWVDHKQSKNLVNPTRVLRKLLVKKLSVIGEQTTAGRRDCLGVNSSMLGALEYEAGVARLAFSSKLQHFEFLQFQFRKKQRSVSGRFFFKNKQRRRFFRMKLRLFGTIRAARSKVKTAVLGLAQAKLYGFRSIVRSGSINNDALSSWWRPNWMRATNRLLRSRKLRVPRLVNRVRQKQLRCRRLRPLLVEKNYHYTRRGSLGFPSVIRVKFKLFRAVPTLRGEIPMRDYKLRWWVFGDRLKWAFVSKLKTLCLGFSKRRHRSIGSNGGSNQRRRRKVEGNYYKSWALSRANNCYRLKYKKAIPRVIRIRNRVGLLKLRRLFGWRSLIRIGLLKLRRVSGRAADTSVKKRTYKKFKRKRRRIGLGWRIRRFTRCIRLIINKKTGLFVGGWRSFASGVGTRFFELYWSKFKKPRRLNRRIVRGYMLRFAGEGTKGRTYRSLKLQLASLSPNLVKQNTEQWWRGAIDNFLKINALYRLYITGRKRGVLYAIVDGRGRTIFTFSSGMVAKPRRGRTPLKIIGTVGARNAVITKRGNSNTKKVGFVPPAAAPKQRRIRRLRSLGGGTKPRNKRKLGARGKRGGRRRLARLYFNRFKHHLRPLVLFLVGRGQQQTKRLLAIQLIVVIRGRWFYRKAGHKLVLGLVHTLRRSNRRLLKR